MDYPVTVCSTLFSELMENCDIWYDGGHEEAILKVTRSISYVDFVD